MHTLAERLFRLLKPAPGRHSPPFTPLPLGPVISAINPQSSTFTILAGPLAGQNLRLEAILEPRRADFFLWSAATAQSSDSPVAHCHYDRDPDGTETLWDIFVRPDWRNRGLSSLLVRLSLRRLLLNRKSGIGLRMRRVMQIDTASGPKRSATSIRLQNIGIGLLTVRLGFVPEPGLESALTPANISSLSIIPAGESSPPGYLFRLKTQPGLITICQLEAESQRPVADEAAYRRFVSPAQLCQDCRSGRAIAGNIDYELTRANAGRCFCYIATTASEYQRLLRRYHH